MLPKEKILIKDVKVTQVIYDREAALWNRNRNRRNRIFFDLWNRNQNLLKSRNRNRNRN